MYIDFDVDKLAFDIIGEHDQVYQNGPGRHAGIGAGSYDGFHKFNRQLWRQATSRIVGRDKMQEIIMTSARQVCDALESTCLITPGESSEVMLQKGITGLSSLKRGMYCRRKFLKHS